MLEPRNRQKFSDDDCLEILNRYWSESEGVNVDGIRNYLGNDDQTGDFFASALKSNLRGWQSIAARELRELVTGHINPPTHWLEALWEYAEASITSDPDEMMHLFTLIRIAKADAVRRWIASPLVRLSERRSVLHQRLGFEGLECLINSGGAVHLVNLASRIQAVACTTQSPVFQESSKRILEKLPAAMPEALPILSSHEHAATNNFKVWDSSGALEQRYSRSNDYLRWAVEKPEQLENISRSLFKWNLTQPRH